MLDFIIIGLWIFTGLVVWGLYVRRNREITVADLALIPPLMFLGFLALILVVLEIGDKIVLWRRK